MPTVVEEVFVDDKVQVMSAEEIDKKVEDAQTTLERVNSWINSCDTKTATVLSLIGVILTIILTNEGLAAAWTIIKAAFRGCSFSDILFLLIWALSLITLIYGFYKLIRAVIASIDVDEYKSVGLVTKSKIFFGSVAAYSSFDNYKKDYCNMSVEDKLNDLLSQIYINSHIAETKHKNYNRGLKFSIGGFIAFILMFLFGMYIYLEV